MKKPKRKSRKPRNRNKNSMLEREEFAAGGLEELPGKWGKVGKVVEAALDVAGANLKNVKKADGTPSGGVIRRATEKDRMAKEEVKRKIASGESLMEEMPRNTGKVRTLMGQDAVDKFKNYERIKTTGTLAALGLSALALDQFLENSGIDPDTATEEELEAAKAEIMSTATGESDKNITPSYVETFSRAFKSEASEFPWKGEIHSIQFKEQDIVPKTDKQGRKLRYIPELDRALPVDPETNEAVHEAYDPMPERVQKQAGGEMAVPPEMEAMQATPELMEEEVPVDTYPNATPEELEAADQRPDAEMETNYMEFVIDESLNEEEQQYLINTLEADPQLSIIFDKVVETASEFSGAGEVEGPGTGLSDSIPARLSDGEFVITKKATDQIGADNLQTMMDEAEQAYDGGLMRQNRYLGGEIKDDEDELIQGDRGTDDDIRKLMSIRANKTPSLR